MIHLEKTPYLLQDYLCPTTPATLKPKHTSPLWDLNKYTMRMCIKHIGHIISNYK